MFLTNPRLSTFVKICLPK